MALRSPLLLFAKAPQLQKVRVGIMRDAGSVFGVVGKYLPQDNIIRHIDGWLGSDIKIAQDQSHASALTYLEQVKTGLDDPRLARWYRMIDIQWKMMVLALIVNSDLSTLAAHLFKTSGLLLIADAGPLYFFFAMLYYSGPKLLNFPWRYRMGWALMNAVPHFGLPTTLVGILYQIPIVGGFALEKLVEKGLAKVKLKGDPDLVRFFLIGPSPVIPFAVVIGWMGALFETHLNGSPVPFWIAAGGLYLGTVLQQPGFFRWLYDVGFPRSTTEDLGAHAWRHFRGQTWAVLRTMPWTVLSPLLIHWGLSMHFGIVALLFLTAGFVPLLLLLRITQLFVFRSLTKPLLWTLRTSGKIVGFVTRPLRRLILEPDVLRGTIRYAITLAMGVAAFVATGNPWALALVIALDRLAFLRARLFSIPNYRTTSARRQRLAGLAASLAPALFGGVLLTHHASLTLFGILAGMTGLLMGADAHVREPPTSKALAQHQEHGTGARLFGPVLTVSAILIWACVNHTGWVTSWEMGTVLLVGAALYALSSLAITPLPSPQELAAPAPEREPSVALVMRNPELRQSLTLLFLLNALTALPWMAAYLVPSMLAVPFSRQALTLWGLTVAPYLGSRLNARIQERKNLANRPIFSWRWAMISTGLLLGVSALFPIVWVWLPAFFLIGFFSRLGSATSRAIIESYPDELLRSARADYSAAINNGIAVSGLLLEWLAGNLAGPRWALAICGAALAGFEILIAVSKKARKGFFKRLDFTLAYIMGALAGWIDHSATHALLGFLATLGACRAIYVYTKKLVLQWALHLPAPSEAGNLRFRQPRQPDGYSRPGDPKSEPAEAWTADAHHPDGGEAARVLMGISSDLHLDDPEMQAKLFSDMNEHMLFVENAGKDGLPAMIVAGDTLEYNGKKRIALGPDQRKIIRHHENLAVNDLPVWLLRGDHDPRLIPLDPAGQPIEDRAFKIRTAPAQARNPGRLLATIPVKREALFTLPDGRKVLVHHGDAGSPLNSDDGVMTRIYQFFERVDSWMRKERQRQGISSYFYFVHFGKRHIMNLFLRIALFRQATIADKRDVDVVIFGHLHIPGMWWVPVSRSSWLPVAWIWLFSPGLYKKMEKLVSRWEKPRKLIANSGSSQDPMSSSMIIILEDGQLELWVWHQMRATIPVFTPAHPGAEKLASAA